MSTGVIVFGYNRPLQLENTLKSLSKQGAENVVASINKVGPKAPSNLIEANNKCMALVRQYSGDVRIMERPLNLNIHILNGLEYMTSVYDRFIVLEDDCFPTSQAWEIFNKDLDEIENDNSIFSRYGHYFLCPSENNSNALTRFQGWGWATTSKKMHKFLDDLSVVLHMNGPRYKKFVKNNLTKDIISKLDVTLKRNCVGTIKSAPFWDGTMCLLTAQKGLLHKKTSKRVVYNCGSNGTHFKNISRKPPWNMIAAEEVWDYYDK